jgi:hypothetical protein
MDFEANNTKQCSEAIRLTLETMFEQQQMAR